MKKQAMHAICPVLVLATLLIALPARSQGSPNQGGNAVPVPWGQVERVSADFLDFQNDSPLQVIGINMTVAGRDALNAVTVVNISDRRIVKYQLGWVVTDAERPEPGTPFLGQPRDAFLGPWQTHEAGRQGANLSTVFQELKTQNIRSGLVLVGVVYAKFEDGSEWSYPLLVNRQFVSSEPSTEYRLKLDPILKRIIEENRAKAGTQGACKGAPEPTGLRAVIEWIKNLFEPSVALAQSECFLLTCTQYPRQCFSTGCSCYQSQCPLEGCNLTRCDYIPWQCGYCD